MLKNCVLVLMAILIAGCGADSVPPEVEFWSSTGNCQTPLLGFEASSVSEDFELRLEIKDDDGVFRPVRAFGPAQEMGEKTLYPIYREDKSGEKVYHPSFYRDDDGFFWTRDGIYWYLYELDGDLIGYHPDLTRPVVIATFVAVTVYIADALGFVDLDLPIFGIGRDNENTPAPQFSGTFGVVELTRVGVYRWHWIDRSLEGYDSSGGNEYLLPEAECYPTVDNRSPVITISGSTTLECQDGPYTLPTAIAIDDVDGPVPVSVEGEDDVNPGIPGVYQLTFTAADNAGNTATRTVNVRVVDTQAPEIELNGSAVVTVNQGGSWSDPGVTTNDACGVGVVVLRGGTQPILSLPGTYVMTYQAVDSANNLSPVITRTVHVVATVIDTDGDGVPDGTDNCLNVSNANQLDTDDDGIGDVCDPTPFGEIAPNLTLLGDNPQTMNQGGNWTDPGYSVTDDLDTRNQIQVVITGQPNSNSAPGTYTVTYRATDRGGNFTTKTRTVIVMEVVTCPTFVTVTADNPTKTSFSIGEDRTYFVTLCGEDSVRVEFLGYNSRNLKFVWNPGATGVVTELQEPSWSAYLDPQDSKRVIVVHNLDSTQTGATDFWRATSPPGQTASTQSSQFTFNVN